MFKYILINYNGFNFQLLNLLAFLAILCGILVVTVKNPIIAVLFLIGLFLNITGYLFLLGINFIAFSYLLVYLGAVPFCVIAALVNFKDEFEFKLRIQLYNVFLFSIRFFLFYMDLDGSLCE